MASVAARVVVARATLRSANKAASKKAVTMALPAFSFEGFAKVTDPNAWRSRRTKRAGRAIRARTRTPVT